MKDQLRLVLYYKDGTTSEIKIRIPEQIGNEIAVFGLERSELFVEDVIANNKGLVHVPTLDDYNRLKKGGI